MIHEFCVSSSTLTYLTSCTYFMFLKLHISFPMPQFESLESNGNNMTDI
jgi:hypothetical protein